mmetsp:Transcript_17371/g.37513  ORF Transcript_17371/g.37513 Transcript_17371/m.37513 type:complete len:80 (+) Transcript_17371:253-492(+)
MGNVVQKKNGLSPSLRPIEVSQHNQHLALDGTASPASRESQIKSIAERRFEERSQQVCDGSYIVPPSHGDFKWCTKTST